MNNAFFSKAQDFTEDEYKMVKQLLNKDVKGCTQTPSSPISTCLMDNLFTHEWIIDSDASHHMASRKYFFTDKHHLDAIQKNKVNLPTWDAFWISHAVKVPIFVDEDVEMCY